MTQAVVVRRDGDAFQARWFWMKAARLLDPESPVLRVGFEKGPSGFDDIWVEYDPKGSPRDQEGSPILREHVQCKWHVSPGAFGYADLADPQFINANARSLLQRAYEAQQRYAPRGNGARFRLLTNWRLHHDDPLSHLINTRSSTLRLDRLFNASTDRSRVGRVRKAWRDHLNLDDDRLRMLTRTLAISSTTDSLDDLRERLDVVFSNVGLRRVPAGETVFSYDDLIFQWLSRGRSVFDREGFRSACEEEQLFRPTERRPIVFGVKSFEHPIDKLEERCNAVLNLVPYFEDRYIRSQSDWSGALYPKLKEFLLSAAKQTERLRLALDAHLTLAFAAGSILNVKAGRAVELEQRTLSRSLWAADDAQPDTAWPTLVFDEATANARGTDLAVAISLTHDITLDVKTHVERALPQVRTLVIARPSNGPGARSIICGRHAFDLAETLTAHLKRIRTARKRSKMIHLFLAGPGAFGFFLGQHQPALGSVALYEYDFEGRRTNSYELSLTLPIA